MNNNKTVSQNGTNLTYLIAGGAIGAGVALLFAPKSGKEMRKDISNVTAKGLDQAGDLGRNLSQKAVDLSADLSAKAKDVYTQTQDKAVEIYNTAKDGISTQLETAKETFDSKVDDVKELAGNAENYVGDKLSDAKDEADKQAKKMKI
jgi:gas vesicle protein